MPDQSTYPTLARECCLQRSDPVWLALALVVAAQSLVLGHLRERYASVWPALLVHVIYNPVFGLTAWLVATPLPG